MVERTQSNCLIITLYRLTQSAQLYFRKCTIVVEEIILRILLEGPVVHLNRLLEFFQCQANISEIA